MPDPIELDGWRITVRRGKHGGFVGYATNPDAEKPLSTHEHRGKGAKHFAKVDIVTQIEIDRALREAE